MSLTVPPPIVGAAGPRTGAGAGPPTGRAPASRVAPAVGRRAAGYAAVSGGAGAAGGAGCSEAAPAAVWPGGGHAAFEIGRPAAPAARRAPGRSGPAAVMPLSRLGAAGAAGCPVSAVPAPARAGLAGRRHAAFGIGRRRCRRLPGRGGGTGRGRPERVPDCRSLGKRRDAALSSGAGWAGGAAPLAWWPGPEPAPGCAAPPAVCATARLGIPTATSARRPTTAHSMQIRC